MIPTIEEILEGLLAGGYQREQAVAWLNEHVRLAAEAASLELRDHFAASIIQGMLASQTPEKPIAFPNSADVAYHIADEMLRARATA